VIVGATGAVVIVKVKLCIASGDVPLLTVTGNVYIPTGVAPGTVILPVLLLMVTPEGAFVIEYVNGIVPVTMTWNIPPVPLTKLALFLLVIAGATGVVTTVSVKSCDASGGVPLPAVIVKVYVPTGTIPAAIVISPLELSMLTPVGAPFNEYVTGVVPVAVTWNVPPVLSKTLLLFELVIDGATGASVTVKVKI